MSKRMNGIHTCAYGRERTTAHMLSPILFFYFNSNVILIVLHAIDTFAALHTFLFLFSFVFQMEKVKFEKNCSNPFRATPLHRFRALFSFSLVPQWNVPLNYILDSRA